MQGRILLGKDKETEREAVFCALDRIGESHFKSRAVRSQKWKYIKNYNREKPINEMATAYRKAMHPIYHLLKVYDEADNLTPPQQALVRPLPDEELYDLETILLKSTTLRIRPLSPNHYRTCKANWQPGSAMLKILEWKKILKPESCFYTIWYNIKRAISIKNRGNEIDSGQGNKRIRLGP